ncbi:alpha/beta fold hydrolase [Ferribacterium limneticum]|uniref:alpha/beta fold hydrolase n=1 Tax=Ferribacterium limneticum TaxID=76259 RepID=UPI001CFB7FE3|nr:alpha/beta hydrolase [Ferribacterium limneticum]UCV17767.1 alpha/beta fold hydrolase [Ferribacterium limneticum]
MTYKLIEERIPSGQFTSHVMMAGDPKNPPLILMHGAGPGASASSNWRHCFPELAKDFYVIAPDMIGFGKSDVPDPLPPHSVTWMGMRVEQVFGLMDHLGIQKANILGNSMGGAVTLQLLVEAPERFEKAMMMGPAGAQMSRTPEMARLLSFYADPRLARYREIITSFVYDPQALPNLEQIIEERFRIAVDPEVRRVQEVMFESMKTGMDALVMSPTSLSRIPHEVALVHGRHDRIVPLEASLYLLQHLKRAELHVLDRCGHWAQIQRWDAMLPLIRMHFLKD